MLERVSVQSDRPAVREWRGTDGLWASREGLGRYAVWPAWRGPAEVATGSVTLHAHRLSRRCLPV